MRSEEIGRASVLLGAGRMTKEDAIDPGAGIRLLCKNGDAAEKGEGLLTMYAAKESQLDEAEEMLRQAIVISAEKPEPAPLIHRAFSSTDI